MMCRSPERCSGLLLYKQKRRRFSVFSSRPIQGRFKAEAGAVDLYIKYKPGATLRASESFVINYKKL